MMKEKTLELKETIELIKQHIRKEKQEKHKTRRVNLGKAKTHNQRRTDTTNGEIGCETKN